MGSSVIIQKELGEFYSVNGFTAWEGFAERGYVIDFLAYEQMVANLAPVAPETITVGSVVFVRRALGRLGIDPPPLDYPTSLTRFLGRRIWQTTLSEIRAGVDEGSPATFIKPFDLDKAFPGHVVSTFRDLIRTARWPREMKLWASDPMPFTSEWRYFVRRNEIIGVGHAKGDPLATPAPSVVRSAITAYAPSAPVAYAVDFGVLATGATHLVEVNDGFSLGCLGLGPLAYSGFLEDRWRELVASAN